MTGSREDLDDMLLEQGRYAELLAAYYPVLLARLLLRAPMGVAYEVASAASLRVLEELHRGKRYPVPFRVVMRKVMQWSLADHYVQATPEVAWPDGWEVPTGSGIDGLVGDDWVRYMIERLTGRQREVAWLRYVEGLDIEQIAERLGIKRNAVDQAMHNAHATMRKLVDDA